MNLQGVKIACAYKFDDQLFVEFRFASHSYDSNLQPYFWGTSKELVQLFHKGSSSLFDKKEIGLNHGGKSFQVAYTRSSLGLYSEFYDPKSAQLYATYMPLSEVEKTALLESILEQKTLLRLLPDTEMVPEYLLQITDDFFLLYQCSQT